MEYLEPPKIGTKATFRKGKHVSEWTVIDSAPYTRKDGKESAVLYWTNGRELATSGLKFTNLRPLAIPKDLVQTIIDSHKLTVSHIG